MIDNTLLFTVPYTKIQTATEILARHKYAGVNILLDTVEVNVAHTLKLVQQLNFQYTISVSEDVLKCEALEKLMPDLYLLVTLSNIYGGYFKKLPLVLNKEGSLLPGIQLITKYFDAQGEILRPVFFEEKAGLQTNEGFLYCFLNDLKKLDFQSLLELETKEVSHIMVAFDDVTTEWLGSASETGLQDNFTQLLFRMAKSKALSNAQMYNASLWKERSKLYQSFLVLSKEIIEGQYNDVLKWYQKEYEVLPLWYKQFGHLVKVITGKRTFKSLFN